MHTTHAPNKQIHQTKTANKQTNAKITRETTEVRYDKSKPQMAAIEVMEAMKAMEAMAAVAAMAAMAAVAVMATISI